MAERKKEYKQIPAFASEEEEMAFWPTADLSEYFNLDESTGIISRVKNKTRKRMMCVRIDEELQNDLKAIAQEHDVPYQALMREILRHGVRAFRKAKQAAAAPAK